MRVVGGEARGRRLVAPKGDRTRPTSDFVREAIFNSLQALVDWDGASVADLFAGTGALGIEALSRGAARCVFVDDDRHAVAAIRRNLEVVGDAEVEVVADDVGAWIRRSGAGRAFDVVFADPPYAYDAWATLAELDAQLVVAESDRPVNLGDGWRVLRDKRHGGTVVTLFEPRRTT